MNPGARFSQLELIPSNANLAITSILSKRNSIALTRPNQANGNDRRGVESAGGEDDQQIPANETKI